jgi:hypothetical protein
VTEQAPTSTTGYLEAGRDRRALVRYAIELELVGYPLAGGPGERRRVWLRNLSCLGVGLIAKRRWERGTLLVLELPPIHPAAPNTLFARVVNATPRDDHFLIGCSLPNQLPEEALQALLQSSAAKPPAV